MADVFETIQQVVGNVQERLSARAIYGEPVTANGVTVIPVARVGFGFGGGGGGGSSSKRAEEPGAPVKGDAGGGGGGAGAARVEPMGFIEISDAGARWVPLEPPRAETVLRALTTAVVLVPGGGRRGLLGRMLLALTGQALIGRLLRPQLPPLPERFRLRSGDEPG